MAAAPPLHGVDGIRRRCVETDPDRGTQSIDNPFEQKLLRSGLSQNHLYNHTVEGF
jgi:hypothetical protein